eukprot:TRINITY_DN61277_c0_g1_i1.p1 TRINITY_DN61277_c0_g1~~TRINITY_DN61277_c0_g1_i1.p1  ORF type:complete len:162 (+),score=32.20 TRINITY_DN61277_c0_g1_i1:129-614(+)
MNQESTKRIVPQRQTLDEAYSPPANYLEISLADSQTHGEGRARFTDFKLEMRTNMPVFKMKESSVRRRYSDFKWLRDEVSRTVQIMMPALPGKAFVKQLPFINNDDGIFEVEFVDERRRGLEEFINKVAGHPLVQGERCLHMFLTEAELDKANYVPGKVAN